MVKSGLPVRYKIGNKSNYVRRGPNYHIPLRNPCEQKNPTEPLKRPLFPLLYTVDESINLEHGDIVVLAVFECWEASTLFSKIDITVS